MQTTIDPPAAAKPRARPTNSLINLSSRVLELALKLRVGEVALSKAVRPGVEDLLRQLEDDARQVRCDPAQVDEVKFALVAFFDETVLALSDSPVRREWASTPLQIVYSGKNWAGRQFFDEHLDKLLEDVEANADVIEVYYLCLVLGFKGKYGIGLYENEEQRRREVIEDVAAKLRSVGRLKPGELSGRWRVMDQPAAPRPEGLPAWVKVGLGALLALALVTYLILYRMLPEVGIVR